MTYAELIYKFQRAFQRDFEGPQHIFIAGGALRDIDNGKAPKDIDIFCIVRDEEEIQEIIQFIRDLDPFGFTAANEVGQGGNAEEYLANLNGVKAVWEMDYVPNVEGFPDGRDYIPFQMIFFDRTFLAEKRRNGESWRRVTTDQFDLNICRIAAWWNHANDKVQILKAPDYKADKRSSTVTLNHPIADPQTPAQRHKTRARATRICQKLGFRANILYQDDLQRQIDNANRLAQQFAMNQQQAAMANIQRVAEAQGFNDINRYIDMPRGMQWNQPVVAAARPQGGIFNW